MSTPSWRQVPASGAVTGPDDVPGLRQALTDLQSATSAAAAAAADAAAAIVAFRPAPFTRGFTYTPEATYTIGTAPGVGFGPGCSAGAAAFGRPTLINRWGSVFTTDSSIRFDDVDLTGYHWYDDALVTLPPAWFPGAPANGGTLPPMSAALCELSHLSADGTTTKQTDPFAQLAIGKAPSGTVGIYMVVEHLNSSLFVPGDYLSFLPSATGFFVLPNGADFT